MTKGKGDKKAEHRMGVPTADRRGKTERQPRWRQTLYVTWLAQFLSIVGFSFAMPFIPYYIRELGVTDERMVPIWAGVLATGHMLMRMAFSPIWGTVADRYGRKLMVERAMFGGAVLVTLMGRAKNVYQLLALRLLQGAVTGTATASITLVSSIAPSAMLGYSLGLMETAISAGRSAGPWLGGVAADHFGYRPAFYMAGGLLFLGGCLVLGGTRERFSRPAAQTIKADATLRDVANRRGLPAMLAVFFLVNLAGMIVGPIFPLFVERLAVLKDKAASTTGLILGVSGLVASVAAAIIGRISDQVGHKRVLVACTLLSGLFCIPQAIARSISQLLGIRALFGLAAGGTGPTLNAVIGKIAPRDSYGRAYGLTASVSALGGAIGPMVGGLAASGLGLRFPFIIMGLLLIIVSAVVAFRVREP